MIRDRTRSKAGERAWLMVPLLVFMAGVSPAVAGEAGRGDNGLDAGAPAIQEDLDPPSGVTVALLDFHIPSARVSPSREWGILRVMEVAAQSLVDSRRCRVVWMDRERSEALEPGGAPCLTASCLAAVGRRVGSTYLVKGIIASVSGGLMVRLDLRDGETGVLLGSKSLVAAHAGDLEAVSQWLLLSLLTRVPESGLSDAEVPPLPRRVQADVSLRQLRRVRYVPPDYPPRARRKHIEGVVMVEVTCRADGRVKRVRWLSGARVFRRAVRRAVRAWVFEPRPVDFRFRQPIRFRLDTPRGEEAVTRASSEAEQRGVLPGR